MVINFTKLAQYIWHCYERDSVRQMAWKEEKTFSLFGNTYFYLMTGREGTISIWKIPQMMSSV